jgi:hypothetical protein
VLIIIGLLAGGIVVGSSLVKRARIESAKSLTNRSPIKATEDLVMWFEGSLLDSFANGQSTNGTSISSGWNNIGGVNNISSATVDGTAPIYANSINSIPAVKFEGNNALKVEVGSINNSDYTIMITEQRESNKADNYLLGDPSITGTNQNLLIGYKTDGTIVHSQGGASTSYTSAINGYASYAGPRVIIITHSASEGNKTYVNGILAGKLTTNTAKEPITDLANLAIGKNYIGQIGELAVFKRALSATEITDISDYMSNKWRIKVDTKNTDCSAGIVIDNGCDASSCPISIAGISKTSVDGTASTSTLSCDKTGYTGSITYSCINKTFATTPANASCSCATGYTLVSGSCIPSCNVPTTNGIVSSQVTGNNGTINCTATGYTGSVAYSCASQGSNATITGSCGCSTGYVLASGACVPTNCPVSITGISSPSSVSYTSTSTPLTCNATGYTGTVNYTCTTGTLTATGSCSCATGYSLVSGVCTPITCSITGVTKLNNKTGLAYASSATAIPNSPTSACATGYSGSPTYTCTATGVATIVSNSCITPCAPGSQTFSFTGGSQSFTVPNGCSSLIIEAWGAQGASSGSSGGKLPGKGGYVKGTLTGIASGQTFAVFVGGQNGFNGGGSAKGIGIGGGGSDIRLNGSSLADRIIVGGGGGGNGESGYTSGGGGGSGSCDANYCGGGAGKGDSDRYSSNAGGLNGGSSVTNDGGLSGSGGSGGGLNGGGGGGFGAGSSAGNGGLGSGGNASTGGPCSYVGGGGGGYYGGGGGAGGSNNCSSAGGGGGSSWSGTLASPTFQGGVRSGNGQVIISWQ